MVTAIITTTVFLLLILLVRGIFRKKISGIFQYSLWLLAVLKLLVFPVPVVESGISVMNLFHGAAVEENAAASNERALGEMEHSDKAQLMDKVENGSEGIQDAGENSEQTLENQSQQNQQSGNRQQDHEQSNIKQAVDEEEAKLSFGEKVCQLQVKEGVNRIWTAGSLLVLFYILIVNGRLYVSLKKNRILLDEADSCLPVYLVEGLPTPCLYGRGIYIPAELAGQEEKLHHVLVHETTHFKHWDGLWGMVRGICVAVYWWHPLVWICAYLSMQDCEYACDESTICQLGEQERISYGKTILSLAKIKGSTKDYFSMALLLSGGERKMKKRITRIANYKKGLAAAGMMVVFLLIMGLAVTVTSGKNNSESENLAGTDKRETEDFAGKDKKETEGLTGERGEQETDSAEQVLPSEVVEQTSPSVIIDVPTEIARKENSRYGWSISADNQLLHQNPETGEMEVVVELMDYVFAEEYVDCSFVDENTAYIAYFSQEKQLMELQYTADGAKTWNKSYIPGQPELGVGGIFLSVVDETTGYLLVGSEPGAGMMEKTLYVTKDGGKSLEKVGEPDMRNHPSDLLFITEDIGFLTTKYYGEDPYLYQTTDGGVTWNPVSVEVPERLEFSYVNGFSLEMKEGAAEEATLILEGVGIEEKVYLEYVTKDAGKTWEFVEKYID